MLHEEYLYGEEIWLTMKQAMQLFKIKCHDEAPYNHQCINHHCEAMNEACAHIKASSSNLYKR